MSRRLARSALLGLLLPLAVLAAEEEPVATSTARVESRIEGRSVPDIPLRLADGSGRMLSELARDRALLVTFFYRRCTGVCTPFLQWIDDASAEVGGLGEDYRVLALSFDEADTVADLRAQASAFGLLEHPDWHFAVVDRHALARIAGALEFWFQQRPQTDQFDHGSLLVAVREGRVVRALGGGPGQTQRLRELVWELRGRVMPYYAVERQPLLRCLSFDPRSGSLHLDWGLLLLVAPALAALAAALALFRPWRGWTGVSPRF